MLVIGYWLAFNQPTELEKQIADGEAYVFWVKTTPTDFEVVPLRRDLPKNLDPEAALKLTLEQLVAGPSDEETATGLTTAIPGEVVVNSADISGGIATVDFNEEIDKDVAGSARVLAIREQLERTIGRFPGVRDIKLTINGERDVALEP